VGRKASALKLSEWVLSVHTRRDIMHAKYVHSCVSLRLLIFFAGSRDLDRLGYVLYVRDAGSVVVSMTTSQSVCVYVC